MKMFFKKAALSTLIVAYSGAAFAGNCQTVLSNSNMRNAENGTIFYNNRSGFIKAEDEDGNRKLTDARGNWVHLLRSDVKAPGGVLVIKAGRKAYNGNNKVVLKHRYYDRAIVNCLANIDLQKRFKNAGINGNAVVPYDAYQVFANSRLKTVDVDPKILRVLKGFHFDYKNKINELKCNTRTDKGTNLAQLSLKHSDTGPEKNIAVAFFSAVGDLWASNVVLANAELQWTVRMIPYDLKEEKNKRGKLIKCINIRLPDLKNVKLLRINDLEEKAVRGHLRDREWKSD